MLVATRCRYHPPQALQPQAEGDADDAEAGAGELRLGLASNYMQRYEEYLERRVHGVPEESD